MRATRRDARGGTERRTRTRTGGGGPCPLSLTESTREISQAPLPLRGMRLGLRQRGRSRSSEGKACVLARPASRSQRPSAFKFPNYQITHLPNLSPLSFVSIRVPSRPRRSPVWPIANCYLLIAAELPTYSMTKSPFPLSPRATPKDPASRETEEKSRGRENASSAMLPQGIRPTLSPSGRRLSDIPPYSA